MACRRCLVLPHNRAAGQLHLDPRGQIRPAGRRNGPVPAVLQAYLTKMVHQVVLQKSIFIVNLSFIITN